MRVSYKLNEKDVFEARVKHGGLWVKVLPMIGVVLLAASLVSLILDPKQFPTFVGGIAAGLFLTSYLKLQVWLSFRGDNRLQDQLEATISDSGIDVSSSRVVSKYDWSAFVRYAETKKLFLVYQAPQVFNVFPKRVFAPEEVHAFRSLLDQRLGAGSIAYRKTISPRSWAFLIVVAVATILLAMVVGNISR